MAPVFATAFDKIKVFWDNITVSQRVLIAILATFMVAIFIALIVWLSKPEMTVLYSNLGAEDANRVIKELDKQQVPYSLEQDGTAILVPADKVYGLRIGIAGSNMLTGKNIGYEIFNETRVGETGAIQTLNMRRALEGELARTMGEFPSIESARVHLVIPQRSLFIEKQQNPSASILLKLSGSKRLDAKDVEAIVNLVAMAVEGLDKSRISIADTSGKVLYQPQEENSFNGLTQTQFEHKVMAQEALERRIQDLLLPIVGADRVIARVNADIDFSQKTIRKELFDPEKTVVRSEQRSEESSQGKASIEGGTPDPNFRGDGPLGNVSDQNSSRETRTTNFEINKEEHNIVSNTGDISRLSVAVVVDGTYTADKDGKSIYAPRSDEELKRIRQLVANAVGFDSARGDTIEVTNMPFSGVEVAETPTSTIIADYALRFGKPLLNALLVFLFLILILRPVIMALIRPKVEGRMLEGLEGLAPADERLAITDETDEEVAATAILEKIEDIKAHALQLSEQNMDQALGIIKSWLKDSTGSGDDNKLPAKAA